VAATIVKFINNGSTTGAVNFPQVDLPFQKQSHRVLNVHKNVPGVLKEINTAISDIGAISKANTWELIPDIGYLIVGPR